MLRERASAVVVAAAKFGGEYVPTPQQQVGRLNQPDSNDGLENRYSILSVNGVGLGKAKDTWVVSEFQYGVPSVAGGCCYVERSVKKRRKER